MEKTAYVHLPGVRLGAGASVTQGPMNGKFTQGAQLYAAPGTIVTNSFAVLTPHNKQIGDWIIWLLVATLFGTSLAWGLAADYTIPLYYLRPQVGTTHLPKVPALHLMNTIPTTAIAGVGALITAIFYFCYALYPAFRSSSYKFELNPYRWLMAGTAGPFVLLATCWTVGILEVPFTCALIVLWMLSEKDVYSTEKYLCFRPGFIHKSKLDKYDHPSEVPLEWDDWFEYAWGRSGIAFILISILWSFSVCVQADADIPLFAYFAFCGAVGGFVLREILFLLYLLRKTAFRVYVNFNYASELVFVATLLWVGVSFLVGTTLAVYEPPA